MKINIHPKFYIAADGKEEIISPELSASNSFPELKLGLSITESENGFAYSVTAENCGREVLRLGSLSLGAGIDTYMVSYPQWNNCFFPSFFRCEWTHFFGYFMSPEEKIVGVYSETPIASYEYAYNGCGHRIEDLKFCLLHSGNMPPHHPQKLRGIKAGEKKEWKFNFFFPKDLCEFAEIIAEAGLPVIKAKNLVTVKGNKFDFEVLCRDKCETEIIASDGSRLKDFTPDTFGLYGITVRSENGKISTGFAYCRRPWEWYFKAARREAFAKPPKATTHCESWYGFYTMFLGAKRYPDKELDTLAEAMFDEIMPYAFNLKNAEPKVIADRVQNVSAFVGVLVDRFEADPKNGIKWLKTASRFADWILSRQGEDGAYYRGKNHYTCVIYPAKSILELVEAEKAIDDPYFKAAAKRHYESAERAVNNLTELLENIGTEGEHTFEDGMISCSALQIAAFALTLPPEKRGRYIEAAEHMISLHSCLEQLFTPDCRVRGTTIRYWEAQYDVELKHNMVTGPHGWSAWLLYALYYLYLLTGKEEYLTRLYSGMGACVQLISIRGELRWAFAVDPFVSAEKRLIPDIFSPVRDGYLSVKPGTPALRGKFISDTVGEEYIEMISGWYRVSDDNKVVGGFSGCPLFLKDKTLNIENQGGCCDNDVHEIFKCLEETLLDKAFLHEREDGSFFCCDCVIKEENGVLNLSFIDKVKLLNTNLKSEKNVMINGKMYCLKSGINLIPIL